MSQLELVAHGKHDRHRDLRALHLRARAGEVRGGNRT
jgi:hypothetical protein